MNEERGFLTGLTEVARLKLCLIPQLAFERHQLIRMSHALPLFVEFR